MEKYNKKRIRLREISVKHLRRLVQNETNLLHYNDQEKIRKDQEKLSKNHTLPSISAKFYENDHVNEYVNESDNIIQNLYTVKPKMTILI